MSKPLQVTEVHLYFNIIYFDDQIQAIVSIVSGNEPATPVISLKNTFNQTPLLLNACDMVNGIRTIHPRGLNKRFVSKFRVETPEESWRMQWPKRCEYNNEVEDNSLNTLSDKKLCFKEI